MLNGKQRKLGLRFQPWMPQWVSFPINFFLLSIGSYFIGDFSNQKIVVGRNINTLALKDFKIREIF